MLKQQTTPLLTDACFVQSRQYVQNHERQEGEDHCDNKRTCKLHDKRQQRTDWISIAALKSPRVFRTKVVNVGM